VTGAFKLVGRLLSAWQLVAHEVEVGRDNDQPLRVPSAVIAARPFRTLEPIVFRTRAGALMTGGFILDFSILAWFL
jgi:hypothetical protein